ncbi:MAG: FG-GAP repeat domain-containing protein, partial [Planctomycetota bacterium]
MLYQRSLLAAAVPILAAAVSAQTIPQMQGLSRMTFTADAELSFHIAIGDVNGDGAPDVFMVNFGLTGKKSQLYMNDGNGNFTDVSATMLPSTVDHGGSGVMGDVDGDKDIDIIQGSRTAPNRLQLFLNDGKGKFTDASSKITPMPANFFYDMDIGDVDFDGDLDLVCGSSSVTNRLFINDGKGNFKDVTGIQFPTATEGNWGCEFVDVDRDVDLDVVFTSFSATKLAKLYINNARGTFTDQTGTRFPPGFGMSGGRKITTGDFNGDGANDIYFCNYNKQNKLLLN